MSGIAGGYRLLGAYNNTAPYVPDLVLPNETSVLDLYHRHKNIMFTIEHLVAQHITLEDRTHFQHVTNTSMATLLDYMHSTSTVLSLNGHGGAAVLRFLTADRYIHDVIGNKLGLHVFRCVLARRVTDHRRIDQGANTHPDYHRFQTDGYLMKDFSTMNNQELTNVLTMVSGYGPLDLPELVWTLREVVGNANDNNLDLHIDTFCPTWKIWLYAENITMDHGPLTYVKGSHLPNVEKLSFLYRASTDPSKEGASSYGSFRMGRYGSHRTPVEINAASLNSKGNTNRADREGVWQCEGCVADERDYGFLARVGLVGEKMTLVVADVSGLHARGLSVNGKVRRTFILHGHGNDGGLPRVNPFTYYNGISGLHD